MNLRRVLLLALAASLSACALPPRAPAAAGEPYWNGRLALQVDGDKPQSFSAGFELRGTPQAGELSLYSPLGATLAQLRWAPGTAELQADGRRRQYPSIDALTEDATGTALPLPALFAWLDGRAAEVPGWQADLSRIADGRLVARRSMPLPTAELRIVLQQP
ncbi:outer membrane lipoprotein LolB [Pseudorhodoferax sp.]|uniref:outer membrane lipoprotein LolB n=1 Tax=Pseudorhodoferax sp. TaxID=1993553 RepID=UPI002DD630A9|nr:outer membrane lipoprotein LolB [Pseudorhodoferax sp.]